MRANLVFFIRDAAEQAIERLRRHVVIEIRILGGQQAELGGLAGILVVLVGQPELFGLSSYHRLELRGQSGAGCLPEVGRGGAVSAAENPLGIRKALVWERLVESR